MAAALQLVAPLGAPASPKLSSRLLGYGVIKRRNTVTTRPQAPIQINLRLDSDLKDALDSKCQRLGIDRSAGLRLAVHEWVTGASSKQPVASQGLPDGAEQVIAALIDKLKALAERVDGLEGWKEAVDTWMADGNQRLSKLESTPAASTDKKEAFQDLLRKLE